MEVERAQAEVSAIFDAVLRALDPATLVQKAISIDENAVTVHDARYELNASGRIVVLGVGKSAVGMARGVEASLGSHLSEGLVSRSAALVASKMRCSTQRFASRATRCRINLVSNLVRNCCAERRR